MLPRVSCEVVEQRGRERARGGGDGSGIRGGDCLGLRLLQRLQAGCGRICDVLEGEGGKRLRGFRGACGDA